MSVFTFVLAVSAWSFGTKTALRCPAGSAFRLCHISSRRPARRRGSQL